MDGWMKVLLYVCVYVKIVAPLMASRSRGTAIATADCFCIVRRQELPGGREMGDPTSVTLLILVVFLAHVVAFVASNESEVRTKSTGLSGIRSPALWRRQAIEDAENFSCSVRQSFNK